MHQKDWTTYTDYALYLVTDRDLCLGRPLINIVRAAISGGVKMVQIREKHSNTRDFLELAKLLVQEIQSQGIPIIINDRVDIALASGAAGVHVGQSDMPVKDVRALLGPRAIIGLSVENEGQILKTEQEPVQYLGISPVFATSTKTDTAHAWGLEGLRKARSLTSLPLVAIGGINDTNAGEVLQAGANSLAVVSAICSATDPKMAAQKLCSIWQYIKTSPTLLRNP